MGLRDKYPPNNNYSPPSNSYENPNIAAPIVDRRQVTTRNPLLNRIKNTISMDSDYFMDNVIVPGAWNMFKQFVESNMYNSRKPLYGNYPYSGNPSYYNGYDYNGPYRTTYGGSPGLFSDPETEYYRQMGMIPPRNNEPQLKPPPKPNYREIVITDNGHPDNLGRHAIDIAAEIVRELRSDCELHGHCTRAKLLSLVGYPTDYTDESVGWYDPNEINFKRVSKGYLILVPPVQQIFNQ